MSTLRHDRKSRLNDQNRHLYLCWSLPAIVFVTTLLVFIPSLQSGFLNWDDNANLVNNPDYRGITVSNLRWMFTAYHEGHYHPLTWLSFALDYQLWGMNPKGYHFTNIVLHAGNAVLFYFVALQLLSAAMLKPLTENRLRLTACLSALLFSIHPLRVESVSWVTERRDVLSGFFLLLTVLFYLSAVREKAAPINRRLFGVSLLFYGLSLFSKAIGITLPGVLLVMDMFPLRRLPDGTGRWLQAGARRIFWEKVVYLLLAVPFAVAAVAAQRDAGALIVAEAYDPMSRLAQALFGVTFYLVKMVVPIELSPLYEIPLGIDPYHWRFIRSAIMVVILSCAFFLARRRWPAALASWVCYLVLLSPVLGLAQSGSQMVADRYTYLSCMPWAVLAASAWAIVWEKTRENRLALFKWSMGFAVIAYFITFGAMTWSQQRIWRDSLTLWQHALSVTPSRMVYLNLANALELDGKPEQGIKYLQEAVQVYPEYSQARYSLGKLLLIRGELDEAERQLRSAALFNPDGKGISTSLGVVLSKQGKSEEAMRALAHAVEIDPHDVVALNNLGILSARQNNVTKAVKYFQRVIEINPDDASAHANMAHALLGQGDNEGALVHLRRAVDLNPKDTESLNGLAMIFVGRGELADAVKYQRRVRELMPRDAAAHTNLAITLANQGSLTEATQILEQALSLDPDSAQAHSVLARVLAARGKENEAMVHYQQALQLLRRQRATIAKNDSQK